MKNRQISSPIAKTVAAIFVVALGFGLAKATPGVRTDEKADRLGFNAVASETREIFLTGDGRRVGDDSFKVAAQTTILNENAFAASETFATNCVSELERLAEPAEFDDFAAASTFEEASNASFAESLVDNSNWTFAQHFDDEKWESWKNEIQLTNSPLKIEFANAVAPNWNDETAAFAFGAASTARSLDFEASSVVDPKLARWAAIADVGSGTRFVQETKTSVVADNRNEELRQNPETGETARSSTTQNVGGAIYPSRRGGGHFVVSRTFDSDNEMKK